MKNHTNDLIVRAWLHLHNPNASRRAQRGEVTASIVFTAGMVLAAVLVVGILYAKLSTAAEGIDVNPGVGG